jgi:hypothetical protein
MAEALRATRPKYRSTAAAVCRGILTDCVPCTYLVQFRLASCRGLGERARGETEEKKFLGEVNDR